MYTCAFVEKKCMHSQVKGNSEPPEGLEDLFLYGRNVPSHGASPGGCTRT